MVDEAPFLKYWKDFKKYGFDPIELLMDIGNELRNQLHIDSEDDEYLISIATERYFTQVTNYFREFIDLHSVFSQFSLSIQKNKVLND